MVVILTGFLAADLSSVMWTPGPTKVERQRSLLQFCLLPHEKECWQFSTLKVNEEHPFILNLTVSTLGSAEMPQSWPLPSRVFFWASHRERERKDSKLVVDELLLYAQEWFEMKHTVFLCSWSSLIRIDDVRNKNIVLRFMLLH